MNINLRWLAILILAVILCVASVTGGFIQREIGLKGYPRSAFRSRPKYVLKGREAIFAGTIGVSASIAVAILAIKKLYCYRD